MDCMEVIDFPNYLIYSDGRFQKIKGQKKGWKTGCINEDGYYRTGMSNEIKKDQKHYIHRLVARHFLPNPDNLPEVDHIDRNPINNHVSNLRWADRTTQNRNKGTYKTNTSGYPNVYINKRKNRDNDQWFLRDTKTNPITRKCSNSKIIVLCHLFIHKLKIKSGLLTLK